MRASNPEDLEDAERDVKSWLRTCHLRPGVSTPVRFLYGAYRAQGGRRSYAEFAGVIVCRCKGLRTATVGGAAVVHGVAPRW